ncbi:DNA-binding transcriptional response regulator, NtrC family, contains REC, AAA-type ATPase, and a Fis-type DNA-binding domains [Chitinophaga jiangningensis]|uniref:DNA-binding transcriptional response regulator, NtrC family, contains REC, AAA-type ATPase, and a Fis-type DNA-binding domains n=1 Tax=Chitinophaga jiangningensis TaxID=1419482 RepID=A0A1M6WKX7_9BACT|nr:sigma-54 dependent transcriptional regulator [Chitinophaga jiangningensis]SHK94239.1 DNA-binding transcriptional response regulator, NtrC family, contains REC, AAA-type ATPase, and a Fis-type DNA-binding domains [Chitinophaga jiangningensis]
MNTKILIVEDQFIEADNLRGILRGAGYIVCKIARSVPEALQIIEEEKPSLVLVDIYLKGPLTGIDLAKTLRERHIAFVYLSANSNKQTLDAAKATRPYGFLVKPFREKDVLVMLDVAWYLHRQDHGLSEPSKDISKNTKAADFREIIGESDCMKEVMKNVHIVGGSDISVLILGESGTGKELIARSIHQLSERKQKPFVAVNCAALPANLIESELFGHEKGSFTGASEKRIGKFEQGNQGTVFLDEIGELPLDLQAKLLRVLQEKEIEPIGGKTKKIDVRIVAATNRNLEEEVAAGKFRLDLYYRINIFPILLPPLRERKDDIVALAKHFVNIYALKEKKEIDGIADHVIQSMLNYNWPGNIRELENAMARAVLLTNGPIVNSLTLSGSNKKTETAGNGRIKSLVDNERDHILYALEQCGWKIYGEDGAAALLELHPSTLNSRIKKLGIEKKYAKNNSL